MTRLPRGLKNNNPLNIRRGTSSWQGLKERQTDPDFCQFKTIEYGFRAAFRLLHTYHYTLGLHTLRDIINRWAPPSENNTSAYVSTVAKRAGLSDVSEIDTLKGDTMRAVVSAMSYVENGVEANEADVAAGWELFMQNR